MPGELTTDPMECLEYLGMSKHRCQPDSNHVTSGGCTCPPITQITYIEIIAPHEPVLMFFPIVLLTISGLLLVQGQRIFFSEANQILHSVSVCASQKMPPLKLPGTEHNGIALEYYFISIYNVANPTLQSTPTPILSVIYRLIVIVIRCQPAPLIVAVKTAKRT